MIEAAKVLSTIAEMRDKERAKWLSNLQGLISVEIMRACGDAALATNGEAWRRIDTNESIGLAIKLAFNANLVGCEKLFQLDELKPRILNWLNDYGFHGTWEEVAGDQPYRRIHVAMKATSPVP